MNSFKSLILENYFLTHLSSENEHRQNSPLQYSYLKHYTLQEIVHIFWGLKSASLNIEFNLSFKEDEESEVINQSFTYSTLENLSNQSDYCFCPLSGSFSTIPEKRMLPCFNIGSNFFIDPPVIDTDVATITRDNLLNLPIFSIPIFTVSDCYGNISLELSENDAAYNAIYPVTIFDKNLNLYAITFEPPEKLQYNVSFEFSPQFYEESDFQD